jgi:tetratricopeptide (TPR) repeat protein
MHSSRPDAPQLLNMALAAMARNDAQASIDLLKQAIALDDELAEAHYLLGAEYASRGEYDAAVAAMRAALARKPELAVARLQLGLLLLTLSRVEEAASTWGLLDALPPEHPLHLFKSGLMHLVGQRFEQAVSALKAGIERNTENPALNRDMQRVIEQIRRQQAGGPPETGEAQHYLVSAYRKH